MVIPLLEEARERITAAWREEEAATRTTVILKIQGRREDNMDARRLFTFTKALLLFVRAYQDALYGVIFELVTGKPAGDRRIQKAADSERNPVGEIIRKEMPEYFDWFTQYRAQRNAIKEGVGFSTIGPTQDFHRSGWGAGISPRDKHRPRERFPRGAPVPAVLPNATAMTEPC